MSQPPNTRIIRAVALPTEHGGWGFLAEPILLGLLLAPTAGGAWFGLAGVGAFLLHQPLKLTIKDWRKGRRVTRTQWAERFAALYGLVALGALLMAAVRLPPSALLPLLIAAPFGIVQLVLDARSKSRTLAAEVSGALALGVTAPIMVMAAGWAIWPALLLWGLLALRAVPSILYVRARLRLERDKPEGSTGALAAHFLALASGVAAVGLTAATWPVVAALTVLAARAAIGLSAWRRSLRAPLIGALELAYGALYVIALFIGAAPLA